MEMNTLNIVQAIGMIAGVCAAVFVAVLVKIAVKESRRITKGPIQLDMLNDLSSSVQNDEKQRGLREGAALSPTHV